MKNLLKPVHMLIGGLERGGTQRNCVNIANMLAENGHSVKITTVRKVSHDSYQDELNHSVELRSLNYKRTIHSIFALFRFLMSVDKDTIILIMNYELLPFIVLIAKIFRKKNKILFRNMNYISKSMASKKTLLSRIFLKYFMLFAFPFIDIVIHQCNEMKKDFDSYCFFHPNQSVVINNIVRTHQNKPITQVAQTPYILLVGRLVKQKNIKFAIDILKLCHKKNFKVDLIVIGEGELLDDLKRYSVRYGLSDYVKFLGNKNNVNDYYRSAHATILTSDYEGFPNVLIESMSCGTPVVAHNCKSGPEELIVNGKNGFLVNFQNDSEFVDAILKIKDIDRSDISSTITNYLVNNVYKHYSKIL